MTAAPEYFEHGADIGVIGRGVTVEAAFEQAARAMFAIMVDIDAVRPDERIDMEFDEDDVELALVRWLNALLAAARERGVVLSGFELAREGNRWRGMARGERWRETMARGTEVKGATLTALSVRPAGGGWEARCVVDV
jgi:SHS2 domain-containing protein